MAYDEKYVTDAAGGTGDGSEGDPWTLAEALDQAVAGDRVNILSDSGYGLGAESVTNAGTPSQLICFRGYNSSIGDLENPGWNADGTLDTTDFPVITVTGNLNMPEGYVLFQNLVVTGSIVGAVLGDASADNNIILECSVTNTANSANAHAYECDNDCLVINSDFECTGASHDVVVNCDQDARLIGCRFKGVADVSIVEVDLRSVAVSCLFQGLSGNGVGLVSNNNGDAIHAINCTFYDLATAISTPDAAPSRIPAFVNNHVTDNGEWLNNLNSGSAAYAMIEVNNRTRDNTTPRTGIGDGANIGEVTTDTGGAGTDYTDAGGNNFRLISGAPGKAAGVRDFTDCGAYQREEPAGGAGGNVNLLHGKLG